MKKMMIFVAAALFAFALGLGCSKKAEKDTGKIPPAVKKAEIMDTTRLDSAMMDTMKMDSSKMKEMTDSATHSH